MLTKRAARIVKTVTVTATIGFLCCLICISKDSDTPSRYWPGLSNGSAGKKLSAWASVPDFVLMVRTFSKMLPYYDGMLVESMRLFWPDEIKLVVVLDNESSQDHIVGAEIAKRYPYPSVHFEKPAPHVYCNSGYDRQQWSNFYPENYTDAEYVGIVDTDTLFVTMVTPELLFENGKPVVIGLIGKQTYYVYQQFAMATEKLFGTPEVFRCMVYFPVLIKVRHIIEARHYLEKRYNKSFDDIYRENICHKIVVSQFHIMCQYIYLFHRNEYRFYLQSYPRGNLSETEGSVTGRVPYSYYKEHFTPDEMKPFPRVAIHGRHHNPPYSALAKQSKKKFGSILLSNMALMEGLCYSGGFNSCPAECSSFNRSKLHLDLFKFSKANWSWDNRCMDVQKKHYSNLERYRKTYGSSKNCLGGNCFKEACRRIYNKCV